VLSFLTLDFLPSLVLLGAAAAGPATDCGSGVSVRLSAATTIQGGVLLAEVAAPADQTGLAVSWNGAAVPVWSDAAAGRWHALLGVDLERSEGSSSLVVDTPGRAHCSLSVAVEAGDFVVRRLSVAKRYVELSPRDQARADRDAARLASIFSKTSPKRLWDGAFRLPVDGASPSDNFGQKRILNGVPRSPHAGVDFSMAAGTPVIAPQRGRVVLASTLFFSGRTVVLDHGLGLFSFYGHLSALGVKAGDVVKAGDRLGAVGATGRATGPHLHWSVRIGKARVNPLSLVALLDTSAAGNCAVYRMRYSVSNEIQRLAHPGPHRTAPDGPHPGHAGRSERRQPRHDRPVGGGLGPGVSTGYPLACV
jgi:hypothetical protein